MGYDIYFVRRSAGESFADALETNEESHGSNPGPLSAAELEQWQRIVERAGEILTGIQEFGSASSRELTDTATGIQLTMIPDEVGLTVPGDRPEQDSVALMSTLYALARIVEDETGLEGYDPQLGEPVTDPRQRLSSVASPRRRDRTDHDDDDDEDWGAFAGTRTSVSRESPPAAPPAPPRRRWWEFWKR